MEEKDAVLKALQECDRRLGQLKRGEQLTAEAEATFGQLADRIDTVIEERRAGVERRAVPRPTADRRRSRLDDSAGAGL